MRRDFTINGLFYDPLEDRVIDFVGGRDDLAHGVIPRSASRASASPKTSCGCCTVRQAAVLNFTLDPATRTAIVEMADQITVIGAERIAAELRTMLTHRIAAVPANCWPR